MGGGSFSLSYIISTNTDGVDISLSDVDKDGDLDLFTTDWTETVAWFQNDGTGDFGAKKIIDNGLDLPSDVEGADLDGDVDLLIATRHDNLVGWYENDGNQNFGDLQIIEDSFAMAKDAFPVDIDDDGDFDILACTKGLKTELAVFFNDGNANFTKSILDTNYAQYHTILPFDLNEDGHLDVVAVSLKNLIWFENLHPASIKTVKNNTIRSKLYPNPVDDHLFIEFDQSKFVEKVEILNIQGQVIQSVLFEAYLTSFDIEIKNHPPGSYVINVYFEENPDKQKFIVR